MWACKANPALAPGGRIGGDTMSVTSGVVSRIEVTSYVHGSTELLGVQTDAAINAGNSGAGRTTVLAAEAIVLFGGITWAPITLALHTCPCTARLHVAQYSHLPGCPFMLR